MKGSYFLGNSRFEVREMTLPDLGDNDILVKNMVCGVCGTDIHIYHGEPGSADVNPPVVLGHEYSGRVDKVGSAVTAFHPGDKITVDPNIYCGVCRFCRDGKKQLCESMSAIGVTRDGGFAEYSVIPASQAFLLDPELAYETGAMAEPLACAIHGIDLAGIRHGDSVLVIGGGAIGLLMVQLAKLAGAAHVVLSEPVEIRRKVAESLGADASFDPITQDPAGQFAAITGKAGADIVIECVGKTVATKQAFDCAAKGATLLLFSVPSVDATFELPLFDVFKKELTIKGSFVNPDTHARAVALLNSGKISVAPLITHRYGIDELEQAIKMQMSAESIKVVVTL
jgi:2-desacetyl-2-hydroxyethyl bacteriochlorophyllide A dehydrogenase